MQRTEYIQLLITYLIFITPIICEGGLRFQWVLHKLLTENLNMIAPQSAHTDSYINMHIIECTHTTYTCTQTDK